jgi:hypothetical protein
VSIEELGNKLDKITDNFASQIKAEYPESSQVPAKEQDVSILGRHIHDTLRDFKDAIIEYLKQA